MNLRHLRILNTLQTTRSMVKTAAQHGIRTSAVSQALAKLEQELDVTLVDRRTRPIKLTKAGVITSMAAERIGHVINELSNDLSDINDVASGRLRLGIIDGLESALLPAIVRALNEKWPHRTIVTRTDRTDHLLTRLQDGEIDLAICGNGDDYIAGLDSQDFLSEPLVAIIPRDQEPAGGAVDLGRLPMIQYNPDFPLGRAIEAQLRRSRFNRAAASYVDSTHSLISLVIQMQGWAVTTPLSVLDHPNFLDQIKIMPTPFPLITRSIAIWTRAGEMSSAAQIIRYSGHTATRRLLDQYHDILPLDADHLFPAQNSLQDR